MNEPILNSGFPQVAKEPEPFTLNKRPDLAQPERDDSQEFTLPPFTFAVAEKVAKAAQHKTMSIDVMSQAMKGVPPLEYFDSLGKKAQEVTSVNDQISRDIADLHRKIAELKPMQADTSGFNSAMSEFNRLVQGSPQAPILQQMNITDNDKYALGLAMLLGANPNEAIGNFVKVKQGFTDQQNELAQNQFKLDSGVWGNQVDAAGKRLTEERQLLGDTQDSFNRQYNDQLDALNQQANRLAMTGRSEQSNVIRRQIAATNEWKQKVELAKMDGEVTQAEFDQMSGIAAKFLEDRGLSPDLAATLPMPTVGKTERRIATESDDKFRDAKYIDDKKRADDLAKLRSTKQNFDISMTAWKQYIANLNRVGIIDDNDIQELAAVRSELAAKYGFTENHFPMPKPGMTWQRVMAEASGKRQDAAATRQLGGELADQYWKKRESALKAFDVATEPLQKAFEDAGKERDRLAESMKKAQEKYQESQTSDNEKSFTDAKAAYDRYLGTYQSAQQKYQSRTQERGRLVETWDAKMPQDSLFSGQPFDPGSLGLPSGNVPSGYIPDGKPNTPPPKATRTLQDPRGGNPATKDKKTTQNTPATTKPVESKPAAKNEQKNVTKSKDTYRFGGKK